MDPLAENYYFQSPYAYAANNPLRFIDFMGMGPGDPSGFWQSFGNRLSTYFENTMTGVVDRIYEPNLLINDAANAANGIMTLASDVTGVSNLVGAENKTANALGKAINTVSELPSMSSGERGAVAASALIMVGEIALTKKMPLGELKTVEGTKALTQGMVPNAGGKIVSFTTEETSSFYRVYSKNPNGGAFLTKTAPKSSAFAREGLALPSSNTASFIQEVTVPSGVTLQRSRAIGAFGGKRGGLEQFEILNRDSRIIFHSGVPLK